MVDTATTPAFPKGTHSSNRCAPFTLIGQIALPASATALVALFFWQVFITMPHLALFSDDTLSFMQKEPQRGPAIYYFWQLILSVRNDFYAIAVAQTGLLAAVTCLLAYSIRRTTDSGLLAVGTMVVCLFKVSLVGLTQEVASDSLFSTACLGLLASALLVLEKSSPMRIGLFLLFGFAASFVRSVGAAILWPLVFGLALRFWPAERRTLGALVAGSVGIYVLTATISYVNYGIWTPQAQLGLALICGATFVADETVPLDVPYPHRFAAATVKPREDYERASSWAEQYQIMDQYYCSKSWRIAEPSLIEQDSRFNQLGCFRRQIVRNDIFKQAALAVFVHNPLGYLKMAVAKFATGVQMLPSNSNYPLEMTHAHGGDRADQIAQIEDYIHQYSQPNQNDCNRPDLLLPLMKLYLDDWRNTPRALKMDLAKPLRDLFDVVKIQVIDWLFVGESAIVLILVVAQILRRRRITNLIAVIVLLVLPVWSYLFAQCLVIIPILRYMDATSPFVYIAVLVGGWGLVSASINLLWRGAAGRPAVEQGV